MLLQINYFGTLLASGRIIEAEGEPRESENDQNEEVEEQVTLAAKDIYKMLYLKGYSYK